MRQLPGYAALPLLVVLLITPVAFTGCSARASGTIKGTKATTPTTPIDTGTSQTGSNVQQHEGTAQASK